MRVIQAATIKDTIYDLILKASYDIGSDVYNCVKNCAECEKSPSGKVVLNHLPGHRHVRHLHGHRSGCAY